MSTWVWKQGAILFHLRLHLWSPTESTKGVAELFSLPCSNVVSSLVIHPRFTRNGLGWISNQNYFQNNCLNDPGSAWAKALSTFMTSPGWNDIAPWLRDFCNQTEITFNGVTTPCNPLKGSNLIDQRTGLVDPGPYPATNVSGACSGYATGNSVNVIVVNASKANFNFFDNGAYIDASNVTQNYSTSHTFKMNAQSATYYDDSSLKLNDYAGGDWGIDDLSSPVYSDTDNFVSCPLRSVGIQSSATKVFNIKKSTFKSFRAHRNTYAILNRDLPPSYHDARGTTRRPHMPGKAAPLKFYNE